MTNIRSYTNSQLEAELKRRKQRVPEPLETPDFTALTKYMKQVVDNRAKGERNKDMEHYAFDYALEAVFGKIWDWWNSQEEVG